jgi:hypothetical protein
MSGGKIVSMETAAAILTVLAFEHNDDFRTKLSTTPGEESSLVGLIMPLFRRMLSQLQDQQQSHDAFPCSIPEIIPVTS